MSKLHEVLRLLKGIKQSGSQWAALCPAHDDSSPSLAISEGDDGRVLLHCHAGCDTKDVVRRIGLSMADLMPPNGAGTKPCKHPAGRPQPGSREAALEYLVRQFGKPSHVWDYHDRNGNVAGATVRFDTPTGKETRPMSLIAGKWVVKGMPEPRPLYGLPALAEASLVVVTEGEKAAEAARLLGYTATTSAQGSNSPSKTDWSPLAGKDVVILPDNDAPGRAYGEKAAVILAGLEPSARVKIVTIPGLPDGGDVADLVHQGDETGIQNLRAQIDQLIAQTPEFAGMMPPSSGNGEPPPGDDDDDGDPRPVILLDDSDRPGIIDGTVIAISPSFFKYGNEVVRVINTPGGMTIAVATQEGIEDIANRLIRYQKAKRAKNGETGYVDSCAPPWLGKMISKKQDWPELRELNGIRRGPFLREDGSIGGLEAGYDAASKYFVDTDEDWSALKSDPTKEDVDAAVKLLRDLVGEFPFENEVSESVWIASVLTYVARDAIRGPVPLFLFDATTPGSGKTLLAKIASRIAEGGLPGIVSLSRDKEEQRKAFTSLLLEGSTFIVIDNVTGAIESPVLNGLVTAEVWKDRRLGSNTNVTLPNRAVIIITANYAKFDSDTARRMLRLRLAPKVDHPQDRTFQIPDILDHVRHKRPKLLIAALQILRFHVINQSLQTAAGRGPDCDAPCLPFGSFESWARVVQQAMTRLGLADPVLSVEDVRKIDVDLVRLRAFIQAWRAWDSSWEGTAQNFINAVFINSQQSDEVLELQGATLVFVGKSRDGHPTASDLGAALGKASGRVVEGYTIDPFARRAGGNMWRVTPVL
jgi:putative DNA primase/helicase